MVLTRSLSENRAPDVSAAAGATQSGTVRIIQVVKVIQFAE